MKKLEALQAIWKEWSIELIADVVATYLTGPAYGWANVRLCMNISGERRVSRTSARIAAERRSRRWRRVSFSVV